MYGGNAVETLRMTVSTKDGTNIIRIPDRFLGEDVYVTITSFKKMQGTKKRVKAKDLQGVAQGKGVSLDDVRYERLMAK